MKIKQKRVLSAVILLLILLLLALLGWKWLSGRQAEEMIQESAPPVADVPQTSEYVSPVDFSGLQNQNKDIYAWIRIPDTCVDYPIVQRTEDNSYYLRRDIAGEWAYHGSIFTENYNTLTFEDPITVVYGHNITAGRMFGDLKDYSDQEYFNTHNQMTIYLPTEEKHYTLVAAVPFDDRHLLYKADYTDAEVYRALVNELLSVRDLNAVIAGGAEISEKDRLVILSTCYYNIKSKRYLVIWKETEE
ncbi:MAG: class B sortase [Clostridia bacterium]|nr:class B sortase [Clostridia bacterium]